MSWSVTYLPEVQKDVAALSRQRQLLVKKAIDKVRENPLPQSEGGFGKPLGNRPGSELSGLLKIKLRAEGLRIVYKLVRTDTQMLIVVVGVRDEEEVYELAARRHRKHGI